MEERRRSPMSGAMRRRRRDDRNWLVRLIPYPLYQPGGGENMAKTRNRQFAYTVDIQDADGSWGVHGFKHFKDGRYALSFAENLADTNREILVTVEITPLSRSKWPRKG